VARTGATCVSSVSTVRIGVSKPAIVCWESNPGMTYRMRSRCIVTYCSHRKCRCRGFMAHIRKRTLVEYGSFSNTSTAFYLDIRVIQKRWDWQLGGLDYFMLHRRNA